MTREPVPHDPLRPLWRCRACGAAWPCQPARLRLLAEFHGRGSDLLTHLGDLLKEASDQLRQLNGHPPDGLADRFLGWTVATEAEGSGVPATSAFESADLDLVFRAIEMVIRDHWGGRTCPRCADSGCPQLDWADAWLDRGGGAVSGH
ncbi:flavin reductase [Salinispora arenicola]|uniref:flavin reductase n=1 Tax=Salinispora arenicola TaxID=168697 RepID=UPI00207B0C3F|nr:flavin reductase [Salinispora arenicola]MCN0154316.1 flavin reductase [Salinispora arenicola]